MQWNIGDRRDVDIAEAYRAELSLGTGTVAIDVVTENKSAQTQLSAYIADIDSIDELIGRKHSDPDEPVYECHVRDINVANRALTHIRPHVIEHCQVIDTHIICIEGDPIVDRPQL